MLSTWLVLVLACGVAWAQYPYFTIDTSQSFNMCYTDADCAKYPVQNASDPAQVLTCNYATGRCETTGGAAAAPAFKTTCPGMTMALSSWRSSGTLGLISAGRANYNDGILTVALTFPATDFEGIVRVYALYCPPPSPVACYTQSAFATQILAGNLTIPYDQQQYVNAPTTVFTFRNLPSLTYDYVNVGAFGVAYFDKSGCTLISPSLVVVRSIYEPGYFGSLTLTAPGASATTIRINSLITTVGAYGRTAYMALPNPPYVPVAPPAQQRCPFIQLFDTSGRVIQSWVSLDTFDANGGAWFPPTVPGNLTLQSAYDYGFLSGYAILQSGITYCTYAAGSVPQAIVQNELGVYEAVWAQAITLDLSADGDTGPAPPPVLVFGTTTGETFNTSRMYTRLNLVQFNTYLIRNGFPDPLGPVYDNYVDLSTAPTINILSNLTQTFSVNSICGSAGYAVISFDYSALNIPNNMGVMPLVLYYINLTSPGLDEIEIDTAPIGGLFVTGYFTVTQPGFYALVLNSNLVDGLGLRPWLRSSFQVGYVAAAATQLTSYYNTGVFGTNTNPYLTYAGYGSYVQTEVYLYLPPYLTIPTPPQPVTTTFSVPTPAPVVNVQLFRFSADAFYEAQITGFGGDHAQIFADASGDPYPILAQYTALLTNTNLTTYRRNTGPFTLPQYPTFAYNGATETVTAVAMVQLTMTLPAQLPGYGNGGAYIPADEEYVCSTPMQMTVIADMVLQARVNVTEPICQDQRASAVAWADGGFCMPVTNPYLEALQNASPYQNPCTYFYAFYNVEDPQDALYLYGGQNAYLFPAPSNIELQLVVTDVMADAANVTFTSNSLVPPNSTTVSFLPPVPTCANGTQMITWEFVVTGVVNIIVPDPNNPTQNITVDAITGWQPLDVLAAALYNPNNPVWDLPSGCALLQNMTQCEVYAMCQDVNATLHPSCTGCTRLPICYPGTNGTTYTTSRDGWWEAYAWVPSPYYDTDTGRFTYCRWALSAFVNVPALPYLVITSLRRITVNGTQCLGSNCAAIDIRVYADPNFPAYAPLVQLTPTPPFGSSVGAASVYPPFTNISHVVALGQTYSFALTLDDVYCPVTSSYTVNGIGPLIQTVRTTRSQCTVPSGTAVFYAVYNNPAYPAGTTASVCMFWKQYRDQFFSFTLPMNNPNPTALPFAPDFFASENTTAFEGVSQGQQTVVVYDHCQNAAYPCPTGTPSCDSDALINQDTLAVNSLLNFMVFEFSVAQYALPGGGLVIDLDAAYYAPCYGDTYNFTFSVYDDIMAPDVGYGCYEWYFYEPFTNNVLARSPSCAAGGQPLLPGPPTIGFKANLFNITVEIPTGNNYGFRQSGNYTLVVVGQATGCTQPYPVWIDMVNPFDIVLSPAGATCAGLKGAISVSISGGTPFLPGELYDQTYFPAYGDGYTADNNVAVQGLYITYWCTPFTGPVNCVRQRLSTQVLAGNYTLIVEDRNQCKSPRVSVTVSSPPPITVRLAGVAVPCSSSTYATYQFVVSDGNGPPYAVEQNMTTVSVGQNITLDFVSALNRTVCFDVTDSKGCRTAQQICEVTLAPQPVSVQLALYASCPYQATGIAVATSNNTNGTLRCSWTSNGTAFSSGGSCTLTNIPANSQIAVTMETLNGCLGYAAGAVGRRPPLVITPIVRTTNGVLGGPCIDVANFSITGGVGGPNYTVYLIGDTTRANLTYNRNYTATITGVCRGVQYIVAATDVDGLCVQTYYSLDPQYTFGGNGTVVQFPIGLPPFTVSSGTDGTVAVRIVYEPAELPPSKSEPSTAVELIPVFIFGAFALVLFLIILAYACR